MVENIAEIRQWGNLQINVFIFENVRGMLNHNNGITWEVIKKTFEEDLKYDIKFQVLNSRNYGIPQGRRRLFVVGFKDEELASGFNFPEEQELKFTMQDFLLDNSPSVSSVCFLNKY